MQDVGCKFCLCNNEIKILTIENVSFFVDKSADESECDYKGNYEYD